MSAQKKYNQYRTLLKKLIRIRGGDPTTVDQEYLTRELQQEPTKAPRTMQSVAGFVTTYQQAEPFEQKNQDVSLLFSPFGS